MKRHWLLLVTFILFFSGCTQLEPKAKSKRIISATPQIFMSVDPVQEVVPDGLKPTPTVVAFEPYTARFEIYTLGTKRIFTQAMYHHQSDHVYIKAADPSLIYVQETGVTWGDFFETLPFKITADCLVTGTGQEFCSNQQNQLRFFVNEKEAPDVLKQVIKNGDQLTVRYQ